VLKSTYLSKNIKDSYFGYSISLSADGETALIGAYGKNSTTGAAYIYRNIEGVWTQTAELASGVDKSWFGYSVSLSSDGSTAMIGAFSENRFAGVVYVYKNEEGVWTQTARISSGITNSYFGFSVSLSSDGSTALIGAFNESSISGAAYIYSNVEGEWTQMARLTSGASGSNFSYNVSLSADGTIALIGAPSEDSYTGAAYIYQNIEGTWTQTAKLTNDIEDSSFGQSVSINSDGTVALIGAKNENYQIGAAYIYQNSTGTWKQMARLEGSAGNGQFGYSVALSSDGSVALIGANSENSDNGSAYIYRHINNIWTQIYEKTPDKTGGMLGFDVALNKDGTVAAISAPGESDRSGAVYILS
jgi:hypothetical protein